MSYAQVGVGACGLRLTRWPDPGLFRAGYARCMDAGMTDQEAPGFGSCVLAKPVVRAFLLRCNLSLALACTREGVCVHAGLNPHMRGPSVLLCRSSKTTCDGDVELLVLATCLLAGDETMIGKIASLATGTATHRSTLQVSPSTPQRSELVQALPQHHTCCRSCPAHYLTCLQAPLVCPVPGTSCYHMTYVCLCRHLVTH